MSGVYLTWLADAFRAAGLTVVEYDGWKTRARSSGGYASGRPWCVMFHHTASSTSPQNDASYMCNGSDARPVANVLVARDGAVWVLAAGATNTNGKGRASTFSKGTVPADSMNSYAFGMELANNGTGETYPQAQIDAAFVVSNVVNARCGNRPNDVGVHEWYAPGRKIDPASCNVAGPWRPAEWSNGSGTWELYSLRDECTRRATSEPEDDMPSADEIAAAVWGYPFDNGAPAQQWLQDTLTQLQMIGPMVTNGEATWSRQMAGGASGPASGEVYLISILETCNAIADTVSRMLEAGGQ